MAYNGLQTDEKSYSKEFAYLRPWGVDLGVAHEARKAANSKDAGEILSIAKGKADAINKDAVLVAAKKGEWPGAIERLIVENNYDAAKTLGQIGEAIAGQLRQSIIDTNEPPLKPATIARKGSSKPLVDTGVMLNSVSFEVDT